MQNAENAGDNMPDHERGIHILINPSLLVQDDIERSPEHHHPITPADLDNNPSGPSGVGAGVDSTLPKVTKVGSGHKLKDLVKELHPNVELDEDVEELVLNLADDFIEDTIKNACLLAKHRNASTVEVKDLQLYLERTWNLNIPGFSSEVQQYKHSPTAVAHKHRLALIKTLKKTE